MNTYILCKTLIINANYKSEEEKGNMQIKLDVFFANDRMTQEEYEELTGLLNEKIVG